MSVRAELAEFEKRVVARIRELETAVLELEELRAIATRLGLGSPSGRRRRSARTGSARRKAMSGSRKPASRRSTQSKQPAKRAASAKKRSASTSAGSRPSTRRKAQRSSGATRGGDRQKQVLSLIDSRPGVTVAELAKQISVARTSLYPVVRRLEESGQIRKDGTGLHPAKS